MRGVWQHTNFAGYRYGFNGQEKDDEVSGAGNSYTAEFWQYDSRLGRRWNIDPVVLPWQAAYAAFNNNPIYFIDPSGAMAEDGGGDGAKTGDVSLSDEELKNTDENGSIKGGDFSEFVITADAPNKNASDNTTTNASGSNQPNKKQPGSGGSEPKVIFTFGTSLAFGDRSQGKRPTSVFGFNGQKYYTTTIKNPGGGIFNNRDNDLTEENHILQLQRRFNFVNGYLGLLINKEKFLPNSSDFGYEGPTDAGISYGRYLLIYRSPSSFFNLSMNISIAAGATIGAPRFENGSTATIDNGDFGAIGLFSALIVRVDATFVNRYVLFVAGTLTHRNTFDVSTSIGTQGGQSFDSVGIKVGLGFKLFKK